MALARFTLAMRDGHMAVFAIEVMCQRHQLRERGERAGGLGFRAMGRVMRGGDDVGRGIEGVFHRNSGIAKREVSVILSENARKKSVGLGHLGLQLGLVHFHFL